jgi:hypothetical protein
MENTTTTAPSYTQMLEEVGKQLKERKSALFKRTLLITWPFILLVVIGYLFDNFYDINSLNSIQQYWVLGGGIFLVACSVIYSLIVGFIFEIEKQIWIDSYFDQKNLALSQSWSIAKKLFVPALKFRLYIIWKFYIVPIFSSLVLLALLIYAATIVSRDAQTDSYLFAGSMIAILLFLVGIFIYGYYIKIKLRYTWFLFLDTYGNNYPYQNLFDEMERLNAVSKSESFKKSLIANLGADSVKAITQIAIGTITKGMSQFGGKAGEAFGAVVNVYGQEIARQATNLGNIAAQYILYRFARKELHGQEQSVNDKIYTL